MRIAFRQGLVSFQTDTGSPVYLEPSVTPGFVSHVISPTPTLVAVAHGSSDYLLKFDDTVVNAWGPMVPGVTNHLYWDIDVLTTNVTRGITLLEPVYQGTAPLTPANDQHWFDLSSNLMKVWSVSKNKWLEKIRIFAGRVLNGNVNTITMFTAGSQAGLNTPANPGYILLDSALQPLRKASQNGEFLTDDDEARVMSTVGTSGVLVSPVNKVIPVRAGESIPRMSLVYFSADDIVRLASSNPALIPGRPPVGIMIDALVGGDVGSLVQSGEIQYDQWDFSGSAGKPVYCDSFGQLTLTRPSGLLAYRVGFVKNPTTVLFNVDAETNPQVYTATTEQIVIAGTTPVTIDDVTNGLGERVVTITVPNSSALQAGLMSATQFQDLIDHGTRLTTAEGAITTLQTSKADVSHTHMISDVTALQTALNNKSDITHNHDLVYASITHDHDLVYAAISHMHALGDVTGLQTALDQKAYRAHLNAFTEIFPSVDRTGSFDVGVGSDLAVTLGNKSDVGHAHAISDVTALQTALNDKSDVGHIHALTDVTGLVTALAGKAPTLHAHLIGDITNLQASLNSKSDVTHTHELGDLSNVDLTTNAPNAGNALVFNGTDWVPGAGGNDRLRIVDDFNTNNWLDENEGVVDDVATLILGNGIRIRQFEDKGGNAGFITRITTVMRPITLNAPITSPFTFEYRNDNNIPFSYYSQYQASSAWSGLINPGPGDFVNEGQPGTTFLAGSRVLIDFWDNQNIRAASVPMGTSDIYVWEFLIGHNDPNVAYVGYYVQGPGPLFSPNDPYNKGLGAFYQSNGQLTGYGSNSSAAQWGFGDVIGCVYNTNFALVEFYKNGVLQATMPVSNTGGQPFAGAVTLA